MIEPGLIRVVPSEIVPSLISVNCVLRLSKTFEYLMEIMPEKREICVFGGGNSNGGGPKRVEFMGSFSVEFFDMWMNMCMPICADVVCAKSFVNHMLM